MLHGRRLYLRPDVPSRISSKPSRFVFYSTKWFLWGLIVSLVTGLGCSLMGWAIWNNSDLLIRLADQWAPQMIENLEWERNRFLTALMGLPFILGSAAYFSARKWDLSHQHELRALEEKIEALEEKLHNSNSIFVISEESSSTEDLRRAS